MIVTALISPTKRSTANVSLVAATTSAASWPFQRSRREVTLLRARPVARAATSAFVRPAHQLEGRLDVPPSFGVFAFALLFQGTSLLSGLGNGLVAVCFQYLPSAVVDFAFLHSRGVIPFSSARLCIPIARE